MLVWLKKYGGIAYIAVATVAMVIALFCSDELPNTLTMLGTLNVRWIWMAGGLIGCYLITRAFTMYYYLRRQHQKIRFVDAVIVMGIGQFYSAVTPSATGGQPMQVIGLYQRGVPVSMGTAVVCIKYLGFTCATLLVGIYLWVSRWDMVAQQLGSLRWLVLLGFLINLTMLSAVLLTVRRSKTIDRMLCACVRLGAKLRLVRDTDASIVKVRGILAEYQEVVGSLLRHKLDALVVLVLSIVQVVFFMSVIWALYHAFRMTTINGMSLVTLQALLFIAASLIPLPGAAGAQEGGFCLFFQNIIPYNQIISMMICWRFFSYYVLMIVGFLLVVADRVQLAVMRRRARQTQPAPLPNIDGAEELP